jgi:hypothetical protein
MLTGSVTIFFAILAFRTKVLGWLPKCEERVSIIL